MKQESLEMFQSKSRDFVYPFVFDASVRGGGFQLVYSLPVSYEKTRMIDLLDGEKSLRMWVLDLTECTNVTDRHRKVTAWRQRPRLNRTSRGKNATPDNLTFLLCSSLMSESLANVSIFMLRQATYFGVGFRRRLSLPIIYIHPWIPWCSPLSTCYFSTSVSHQCTK